METVAESDNIEKPFGHCIINWTVENFCLATCKENCLISSPDFYVRGSQVTKWKMILNPRTDNEHILLYLLRNESDDDPRMIWANWKFCLMVKHKSYVMEERTELFASNTSSMVDMHELESVLDNIYPLDSDELNIQCQLLVYHESSFKERDLDCNEGLVPLSEDLRLLYTQSLNYDIVFKIDDNSTRAHKAILYFRNRKLAEIIDKEQGKEFIELSEVNYEAMDKILDYLYSGNMEFLLEKPSISLYEAVLFFGIDEVICHFAPDQLKLHLTIDMQEISYFWIITDFSDRNEIVSRNLNSGISSTTWRLHVYPVGRKGCNQSIALTAEIIDRMKPQGVCLEYGVMNTKKEFLWVKRVRKYTEFNKVIGSNYFIKRGKEDNRYLFEDNTLRIVVKIRMSTGDIRVSSGCRSMTYTDPIKRTSYELLSDDMKCVLASKKFSDAILHAAGSDIKVHKCILSARSPTLAHLIREMSETNTKISFSDVSPFVMYCVLHYIYCGTLEDLELNHYSQVYEVAERLEISSLKDTCSQILRQQMHEL